MNKAFIGISLVLLLSSAAYLLNTSTAPPVDETLSEEFTVTYDTFEDLEPIEAQEEVSLEELRELVQEAENKLQSVMNFPLEATEDQGKQKLQFFGAIIRGVKKTAKFAFTRVVIPTFNLAKNAVNTVSNMGHRVCNPQATVEQFAVRTAKSYFPPVAMFCKVNNFYQSPKQTISKFVKESAETTANDLFRLKSAYKFDTQYISEWQAADRMMADLEGLFGSLGARLQCLEAVKDLKSQSKWMINEIDEIIDVYRCDPKYSDCQSMDYIDFDEFDSNWSIPSSFSRLVQYGRNAAYNTRFIEFCKKEKFFFPGDL